MNGRGGIANQATPATLLTREVLGNQPPAARWLFYALAAAATLVFCWGIWRRARLWRKGRAGGRVDWAGAARRLVRDVIAQRRLRGVRPPANLAHKLLFSGFMVLLLATTLLAVEHGLAALLGRGDRNPVFHRGIYFAVYEFVSDLFGLALIAGCAYFAQRRGRRSASIDHTGSNLWVLAALATLGVTGYLVEGLRIIREQTPQPWLSFVGAACAQAFAALGVTQATASAWHFGVWWFHTLVALGLIAVFPFTRLIHAIAGALRLVLPRAMLGTMTRLDPAIVEETGEVGVARLDQFSRVQLLELDACVSCGRCQDACPAFEAGKPLSPRDVVQDLKRILDRQDWKTPLPGDAIGEPTLWSCTTCAACTDVCPLGIHPLGMITDLRRNLIAEGKLRGAPAAALQKMDRSGNPWGLPATDRMAWAAGLDVPTVNTRPDFEVLYWVGCAAAYDTRLQRVARAVVRLMSAAGVRFAVLGNAERCTGDSARRMGDEFLFQQLAQRNVETLRAAGVERGRRTIVAHCPHCVNAFLRDYPQMGGDFDVLHHSEFLTGLEASGRLPAKGVADAGKVTFHDPCYLARVGGVVEAPRSVLRQAGAEMVEMARQGRQTSCCGAGGGRMWFDDPPDQRVGSTRVSEALATEAPTVAVGCPFCLIMMKDGVAARGASVEVRDIAEILADRLEFESAPSTMSSP